MPHPREPFVHCGCEARLELLGVRAKGTRGPGAEGGRAKCTGGGGTCQEALKPRPPSLVPAPAESGHGHGAHGATCRLD